MTAEAPPRAQPQMESRAVTVGPATLPVEPLRFKPSRRRRWPRLVFLGILLGGGVLAARTWWEASHPGLPPGFAVGNGRLEADQIDISTKFPGRIAAIYADEGTVVTAGQVVARMDTRDLEAQLAAAEAQMRVSQQALAEARANIEQQRSQLRLARQELARTQFLAPKGFASKELLDQRQMQADTAAAGLSAAQARASQAEHSVDAAQRTIDLDKINIADNTLVAPKDGRIQYRLANVGEVLPAGGKVFTMLDTGYVYMDVFLPTAETGRTMIGSEARIVLDAVPLQPIPAAVTFVASEAQFTPKAVETRSERDKLMFRVRLRVGSDALRGRAEEVRSGLPGLGYVRLDPAAAWPASLQPRTAG